MDESLRTQILSEIRRLAHANGGKAPGKQAFERTTGITVGRWSGRFWAKWGDALAEAGFQPNKIQHRLETQDVLNAVIEACRCFGRLPSSSELKLHRRNNPGPPSYGTIEAHFPTRGDLLTALWGRCEADATCTDLRAILPPATQAPSPPSGTTAAASTQIDGFVYLIKSGEHYKIGRSDEIERRMKEIRVALPERAILLHTIKTDDPSGIEAYWHRRFQARRLNGEWFRLSASDVAAFRRRRFQ